jgi:hypothetical protein
MDNSILYRQSLPRCEWEKDWWRNPQRCLWTSVTPTYINTYVHTVLNQLNSRRLQTPFSSAKSVGQGFRKIWSSLVKVEDKKSSNISSTVFIFFVACQNTGFRTATPFFVLFGRGNANRSVATCSCRILCICHQKVNIFIFWSANQVKYLLRKWLSIFCENGSPKFGYHFH